MKLKQSFILFGAGLLLFLLIAAVLIYSNQQADKDFHSPVSDATEVADDGVEAMNDETEESDEKPEVLDYSLFVAKEYGFQFEYPQGWEKKIQDDPEAPLIKVVGFDSGAGAIAEDYGGELVLQIRTETPNEMIDFEKQELQNVSVTPMLVDGRDVFLVTGEYAEGTLSGEKATKYIVNLVGTGVAVLSMYPPSFDEKVFDHVTDSLSFLDGEDRMTQTRLYSNTSYGYSFEYPDDHIVFTDFDGMNEKLIAAGDWNDYVALAEQEWLVFGSEPNMFRIIAVKDLDTPTYHLDDHSINEYIKVFGKTIELIDTEFSGSPASVYEGAGDLLSPYRIIILDRGDYILYIQLGMDSEFFRPILESLTIN